MTEAESARSFYRVPCELQIRFRKIEADELKIFASFGLRPSPHSSFKTEIETQLRSMEIRQESKVLFEKAFQILLNIDQRLERIEESLQAEKSGEKGSILENYEWVYGDLSAGGLAFKSETPSVVKPSDNLLLDMILPSLPEYRLVAAAKVVHFGKDNKIATEFVAIHEEDREYIHRFVIARERELLRTKALERERASDPKS